MGKAFYIGLMSGTSMDAVDAALLAVDESHTRLLATHREALPGELRSAVVQLCQPGDNEVERLGVLDRRLGELFAEAAVQLLQAADHSPADVAAIGSHGQTIRHRPPSSAASELPFSLQIGDPNTIAERTGITTVADFRRRDVAAGGEGAPLAAAFHAAVFHRPGVPRAIVNIGGIANVSLLGETPLVGFDSGPGNTLMDAWIARHQQRSYDREGAWAAGGRVQQALLEALLQHEFLARPPPRSTGREEFNLALLESLGVDALAPRDVQATLAEFTAVTICRAVAEASEEVYLCGGGAANAYLVSRLRSHLPGRVVQDTAALGIGAEWVEAAAFAWLARQTLNHLPGNAGSVTGARRDCVLGGIYPAGPRQNQPA